jgi:hypothetical protein
MKERAWLNGMWFVCQIYKEIARAAQKVFLQVHCTLRYLQRH